MFGLGLWELALILAVALVVLGPERLPKIARQLGRGVRELRRAARDFQTNFTMEASQSGPRDGDEPHPSVELAAKTESQPTGADEGDD